jgi:Uncharacterized conserved protein
MENQFKDFYDVLRDNLDSYRGDYERFVDYGPDLFRLLTEILNQKSVSSDIRLKVSAALAYYVAPFDIIPEQIYGPHGYIDDVFICAYVIKDVAGELGYDFLDNIWNGEEELDEVVEECYSESSKILKDKVNEILAYVGLKDQ